MSGVTSGEATTRDSRMDEMVLMNEWTGTDTTAGHDQHPSWTRKNVAMPTKKKLKILTKTKNTHPSPSFQKQVE